MSQTRKRKISLVKQDSTKTTTSAEQKETDSVLVVEDNDFLRQLFLSQLKVLGLTGHEATNGQEAVEACAKRHFGFVLMDVSMPLMDGLEATRLIREQEKRDRKRRVPIVAVTGISDKETCLKAGMDDFMTKPFLLDHLRQVVSHWMK
jgi:CheY-like chemotaxis protein